MTSISVRGIAPAKGHLKALSGKLGEETLGSTAESIAQHGMPVAVQRFSASRYAGSDPDVEVSTVRLAGGKAALVADGPKVLYIEFGSGVNLNAAGQNPAGPALGFVPESHSSGRMRPSGWWAYAGDPGHGEPGYNIRPLKRGDKEVGGVFWTQGNPPANAMYEAGKEMHRVAMEAVIRGLGL